ncbi:isochorismate-pyruvate lyase [Salinisphaera sp. S4-8]|uniref:isochorismate lyase n=1 Tax=Salinisphaera sp. S4-8 TaxID=633357 RepID=UPI0033429777
MDTEKPRQPEECSDMSEIRAEIDALDKQVVALLGRRYEYVQAAARFKKDEEAVRAPERFRQVLEQRRQWATEVGLNADAIEKLYRDLVLHFIEEEKRAWHSARGA